MEQREIRGIRADRSVICSFDIALKLHPRVLDSADSPDVNSKYRDFKKSNCRRSDYVDKRIRDCDCKFKNANMHHQQRGILNARCIALYFSLHLSSLLAGNELKARLKAIAHDVDFSIDRRFETRNARCGIHDCTFSHTFRAISFARLFLQRQSSGERLVSHVGRTRKLRTIISQAEDEHFAHLKREQFNFHIANAHRVFLNFKTRMKI